MLRLLPILLLLTGSVSAPVAPFRPPLMESLVVLNAFIAPPNRYAAGHRGVDLLAEVGAEVRAPADGVVAFAGWVVDRGVLSVDHAAGVRSSFEPVTASVTVGQRVRAGDLLGVVVSGHRRCAPALCLHWGVRVNGEYVDPMLLLEPLHVRLLPWDG